METPLDPVQISRIEATHRGFFYQHLYAVACMITIGRTDEVSLTFERDEDIEIKVGQVTYYLQIKTRSQALKPSDISGTLARFNAIRDEYSNGKRKGKAYFRIVTNAECSTALAKKVAENSFGEDVRIISPSSIADPDFPPAFRDIESALDWCTLTAQAIPFATVLPETLVMKLAAIVQFTCTGENGTSHTLDSADITPLLEQLVLQLQDFPAPPLKYIPQLNEPSITEHERIKLIVGFSGAGKTAWASYSAINSASQLTYFNIEGMPAESAANALARELAARFIKAKGGLLLTESAGINILQACGRHIQDENISLTIVLDNIHRLPASVTISLLEALPNAHYILMGQPYLEQKIIEATFGITARSFGGWSTDNIAAEAVSGGCYQNIATTEHLRRLTSGLPLFVKSSIAVINNSYRGDTEKFCRAIDEFTLNETTAQEIILQKSFDQLSLEAQTAAAILGISEVPLSNEEAMDLISIAINGPAKVAKAIRELKTVSFVVNFQQAQIALHDALRPIAAGHTDLEAGTKTKIWTKLTDLLTLSLVGSQNIPRLNAIIRLLPKIGEIDALVDLATNEIFHEQGDFNALKTEIAHAANDQSASFSERYWANDALAFWESRDGEATSQQRIREMKLLIRQGNLGNKEKLGLALKEMLFEANRGNIKSLETAYDDAKKTVRLNTTEDRILQYNYALSLYRLKKFQKAQGILAILIADYFTLFGIDESSLVLKDLSQITAMLKSPIDYDNLKRLGDTLQFWSTTCVEMGAQPGLRRINAMKILTLSGAFRTAVDAGMDCTNDFLHIMADPKGAKQLMDTHIFPPIKNYGLLDRMFEARCLYAVVLAWCGEAAAALNEISILENYSTDVSGREYFEQHKNRVEQIIRKEIFLFPKKPKTFAGTSIQTNNPLAPAKPSRKSLCPCGSGKKYKRCHGK